MRPTHCLSLCLCLMAAPAMAQDTYSGAEFDARVSGKTIQFERNGQPFGAEQYFPDRRVIWAFRDGTCQRGIWFENTAGNICFNYENSDGSICWDFFKRPNNGIAARVVGAPVGTELIATEETEGPLECPLPDLGV